MTQSRIGGLMQELLLVAQSGDAAACLEPMAGETRQISGFQCKACFGDLEMMVDEPVSFGGTGLAPNPAEVALAGLAASIQVTLLAYSEFLGVPVSDIALKLSTSMDSRGFFGTDKSIAAGFAPVDVHLRFKGENDPAKLAELIRRVEQCCPVLAVFRQPMQVSLSYDQER
jgi:pyruvate dehydrogenase E2 component (dihydrolipoamide acetyltransferase)